ncbi:MAG: ABC transporter substrate-binding protein [Acidiferrobacterales bacterium]
MAGVLRLTLACGDYEIVRALKENTVRPEGIELSLVTDMDAMTRHSKMIRESAFDVCELSMSSYLMARARGQALSAIPVFLHRRFRHGFIFVSASSDVSQPRDLIGKKVGVNSFQATANVWIRGILEHEFEVPHKQLHWVVEGREAVAFNVPEGLTWTRSPPGERVETMLVDGELDAVLHTDVITPMRQRDPRVRRLFENYKKLEIDYYKKTAIFPIMHTTAIKQEIVDRCPWVPVSLLKAFERAKAMAYQRLQDPRIVPLAWFRTSLEEQEQILGEDPWMYGLGATNRKNLRTLVQYAHEQGLIGQPVSLDELFVDANQ